MSTQHAQPEFSRPIPLDRIERDVKTHKLEASKSECEALAKRFNLIEIEYLRAKCEVSRRGSIFLVEGTIEAKLTQECVVTFAPVAAELSEKFAEKFSAPGYKPDEEDGNDIEPLQADELDLGEIVAQYFVLSLDQYPRAQIVE